jgi:hypothetical protein
MWSDGAQPYRQCAQDTKATHMTTLKLFAAQNLSIPSSTSWYLADLGEFRGKQELIERLTIDTKRAHPFI